MDYPDSEMNGLEPYMGHDEYGYNGGSRDTRAVDKPASPPPEPMEVAPPAVALVLDERRGDELPLADGSPPSSDYTGPRIGYREIPIIPYTPDPRRTSIHPLGLTARPAGIDEREWLRLDADGLFVPAYDPAAVDYVASATALDGPALRAQAGGGGRGAVTETTAAETAEPHDPTEMPFLDHLEEFRWSLLKSIIAISVLMVASWFLTDYFWLSVTRLAKNAGLKLISTQLMEGVMIKLQMSLYMGFILALPFVFYYIWGFVSPGLYEREKKWVLPMVWAATGCFITGVSVAYFLVIPFVLPFVKSFIPKGVDPMFSIGNFISILMKFTIMFGIVFELPMVSYVLAKIGILRAAWMVTYRKYAIVTIFILAAIFSPPDPFSMFMVAIPLLILYEVSIWVARFAGRKTLIG